jgi:hypothetical protein
LTSPLVLLNSVSLLVDIPTKKTNHLFFVGPKWHSPATNGNKKSELLMGKYKPCVMTLHIKNMSWHISNFMRLEIDIDTIDTRFRCFTDTLSHLPTISVTFLNIHWLDIGKKQKNVARWGWEITNVMVWSADRYR